MKKIIILFILLVSLTGCNSSNDKTIADTKTDTATKQTATTITPTETTTVTPTPDTTISVTTTQEVDIQQDIEMAKKITVGLFNGIIIEDLRGAVIENNDGIAGTKIEVYKHDVDGEALIGVYIINSVEESYYIYDDFEACYRTVLVGEVISIEDGEIDSVYTLKIEDSMLFVYSGETNEQIATIDISAVITENMSEGNFECVDYNFDGIQDVSVYVLEGEYNCRAHCWLWNEEIGKFEYNKQLNEVIGLGIDEEYKQLIGYECINITDNIATTYEWVGKDLRLIDKIVQEYMLETDLYLIRYYSVDEGGNLILDKEESITEDELNQRGSIGFP